MATDSFGRRIDYLRISLTDRCNLRCFYCMPEEGVVWRPHSEILTFEEIERFAAVAVSEGVSKIRLTGGEPLIRKGVVEHVRRLKALTGIEGIALTTNGVLLERYGKALAEAGLSRVNISIDSLDSEVYRRITGGGRLEHALAGLETAFRVGMKPVKLNVVVIRSLKQDLLAFARLSFERPVHVRFIEYMPVGNVGSCSPAKERWNLRETVPSDEILERLAEEGREAGFGSLETIARDAAPGGWGPARYYRFSGAAGTVCVISPLSFHFCAECNRLRLTADGRLRPCLFSDEELDVRSLIRGGGSDVDLRDLIRQALAAKPEGHCMRVGTGRGMSQIGG